MRLRSSKHYSVVVFALFIVAVCATTSTLAETTYRPTPDKPASPVSLPSLIPQLGHREYIDHMVFSPDGRKVATATFVGVEIIIWDVSSGRMENRFIGPREMANGYTNSVSFTPDGTAIVAGITGKYPAQTNNRELRSENVFALWRINAGPLPEKVLTSSQYGTETIAGSIYYRHSLNTRDMVFHPDGSKVAVGTEEGGVVIWDLQTGQTRMLSELHSVPVDALAFSPNGKLLVTGSARGRGAVAVDKRERVLTIEDLADLAKVGKPQQKPVESKDGELYVWDTATWMVKERLNLHCASLAISPDNANLLCVVGDQLAAYSLSTKKSLFAIPINSNPTIFFAPDRETLYVVGRQEIIIRQKDGKVQRKTINGDSRMGYASSLVFHSSNTVLYGAYGDKTASIKNLQTGRIQTILKGRIAPVRGLYAGQDDGTLLSVDAQGIPISWDFQQCRAKPYVGKVDTFTLPWCMSANGKLLATCDSTNPKCVRLVADGKAGEKTFEHVAPVTAMCFTPDGTKLIVGLENGLVEVWDSVNGQKITEFKRSSYTQVALCVSPDGRYLAAGSKCPWLHIWDLKDLVLVKSITVNGEKDDWVNGVSFSADGKYIACFLRWQRINVWDWRKERDESGDWDGPESLIDKGFDLIFNKALASEEQKRKNPQYFVWRNESGYTTTCFSPVGQRLAWGACDGSLAICDFAEKKRKQLVTLAHLGEVTALCFSPNGKRLYSASLDGTVKIWDVDATMKAKEWKEITTCVAIDQGANWLISCPDGCYSSSLEAPSLVVWRVGSAYYPFDQFEGKYYRPEIVKQALAWKTSTKNKPIPLSSPALQPPVLSFTSPKYGTEVKDNSIEVSLRAEGKQPIARVELTINGQPLPKALSTTLEVPNPTTQSQSFQVSIPLPPGEQRIRLRAVAYDTEALKSRTDELVLFRPGVKASVGKLYVLAVGINHYANLPADQQLRYAVADAKGLAQALEKQANNGLYAGVVVKVLTDNDATLSNVKFALREMKDTVTENDSAIIFISGHGIKDKASNFYFGTTELNLRNLAMTALNWQDFITALRDVRAKRMLVLADTCHSGSIVGSETFNGEMLASKLNKEAHRLVFVSSSQDEVSIGTAEWGHGAFTKALLEAFESAADMGEKDGIVTFQELRDYVPIRVQALTNNRQHPQLPFLDQFESDAELVKTTRTERVPEITK